MTESEARSSSRHRHAFFRRDVERSWSESPRTSPFGLWHSFVIRVSDFVILFIRHSEFGIASLRDDRRLLNFGGVSRELIVKHAGKISIVQDDQVGVVLLVIVVLPAFIPPAETDHGRPLTGK
jgi:hypothetical protein